MKSGNLVIVGLILAFLIHSTTADNDTLDSLKDACHAGDIYVTACSAVNDSLSEIAMPSGTSATCVWNPGGEHSCTTRVTLNTSSIVDIMTESPLIESMEFIQSGSVADEITFYSSPFVPHEIHVTANGSLFPTQTDPEFWMEVTSIDDITTQAFNFTSINPEDITSEQLTDIEEQYLGEDNLSLGMGIVPDLSVIKTFEEFNWNLTVSYDTEEYLAGIAACNGSFNGTSCDAEWISLTECQSQGSCPDNSYLKDVPSTGLLTVYGADPLPVYGDAPAVKGDSDGDGEVSDFELLSYITQWASGGVGDFDLLAAISNWASG